MLDLAPRLRFAAWLAAAAIVCAGTVACGTKPAAPSRSSKAALPPASDVEEIGWMRLDPGARPPSLLSVKPSELPAQYRSRYRLKPDRRLLYAVEEVGRIVTQRKSPATLSLRFEGDRWKLSLDGEDVGTVPEIPSYADGDRLLRDWSRRLLEKHHIRPAGGEIPEASRLTSDLEQGSPAKVLAALHALNALAAKQRFHPQLFQAAARGTIWLSVQTYDELQSSDPLLGHAWALVALARVLGSGPPPDAEALLAATLGYEAAATDLCRGLPETDPVRAYVTLDPETLRRVAEEPGASPRAQYLHLLTVARRQDAPAGFAALARTAWAREVDPSSLHIVLALMDHGSSYPAAQALVAAAFLDLAAAPDKGNGPSASLWGPDGWPHPILERYLESVRPSLGPAPEAQTRRFERLLQERAAASDGPLLDAESVRAFYRAHFYSGIYDSARFLLDQYSSTEEGEKYARAIDDPAPGTAAELKGWMTTRVGLRRGTETPAAAVQDLETFTRIGTIPTERLITAIKKGTNSATDPADRATARVSFRRLDTRVGGLHEAAHTARYTLLDLRLTEALMRALSEAAPIAGGDMVVRYFYSLRDAAALRRAAVDRRYPPYERTLALWYLRDMGEADVAFLRSTYRELMKEQPEDHAAMDACVELLEKNGDVPGALETVQAWLDQRPSPQNDLHWAHVETVRAKVLGRAGRLDEAWKVIVSPMETGKAECLEWGAWILEHQGKLDEALDLARDAARRYPYADEYAIVARILWRQGKDVEAAQVLNKPGLIGWSDWSGSIADGFADVFAKTPTDRTRRAFAELTKLRVPSWYLADVAKAVGKAGNPKLAFELLTTLTDTGSYKAALRIAASEQLEKADGKEAALAWFRRDLDPPNSFVLTAFQFGRYDLLGEKLDEPANPTKTDVLQLLRAAALIYTAKADDPSREEISRYFASRPGGEDFVVYGRYLLGEVDEPALFARIKDMSSVCSIGWLIGARAAGAGRYEDATDWFEVAVETDANTIPPHAWAWGTLSRWPGSDRTLSQVAKERLF